MNPLDRLLATWAKQNAETIYQHLETKVNPRHNWRAENITDIVTEFMGGWPSEWEEPEPYFEELQHALNTHVEDFGVPLPTELIAHRLGQWARGPVPVAHPLVQKAEHWRNVYYDLEHDSASPADAMALQKLVLGVAKGETAENLASQEEVDEHFQSSTMDGRLKIYTVATEDGPLHLALNDDVVAAMNQDGEVAMLDFDGNRLNVGADMQRVQNLIVQGMKFSKPITDRGELASIVGNHTAAMLLGDGGISVFDLPN